MQLLNQDAPPAALEMQLVVVGKLVRKRTAAQFDRAFHRDNSALLDKHTAAAPEEAPPLKEHPGRADGAGARKPRPLRRKLTAGIASSSRRAWARLRAAWAVSRPGGRGKRAAGGASANVAV